MGHLKDILNQPKLQSFPSSTFEIAGEVPAAQCSEAQIESIVGIINNGFTRITDVGKFVGWNLAGKKVTVTLPLAEAGTYGLTGNTDDWLTTDHTFNINDNDVNYYVHNGGTLILTRNIQSFFQFIQAAGYAATIKGGKLYTNIPSAQLQNACTILFDPLT